MTKDEKTISEVMLAPKIEFTINCPTMGDDNGMTIKLTPSRALQLVNFLEKLAGEMKADLDKTAKFLNISLA